jgi:hypothetical protein
MQNRILAQRPEEAAKSQIAHEKMLEIGKSDDKALARSFFGLLSNIDKVPTRYEWNSYSPKYELVIVNYGTDRRVVHREQLLLRERDKFRLPHTKMTVIRGGTCKTERTVFWQIAFGAEVPKICDSD